MSEQQNKLKARKQIADKIIESIVYFAFFALVAAFWIKLLFLN